MEKLIIATTNQGKLREFRDLLQDLDLEILSLADLNYMENVNETGTTFAENAQIKAANIFRFYPEYFALADDSGLCITDLDNQPGIYSARFGGENTSYRQKFNLIWQELAARQVPPNKWQAHFTCNLCLICPWGDVYHYEREFHGQIIAEARGEDGFGYDPIFYLPEYGKTAAQLPLALKDKISHRALAMKALLADLPHILNKR